MQNTATEKCTDIKFRILYFPAAEISVQFGGVYSMEDIS